MIPNSSDLPGIFWPLMLSYLLGSIPSAVWIGQWFYHIDIRKYGSKNAGATNVMRVLGIKAGIPVLIIDMLKGWAAVSLVFFQDYYSQDTEEGVVYAIFLGILAVIGHIFPIFARFKGGKGVATVTGVCAGLAPLATITAFTVFLIVVIVTKFVSLGSLCAAIYFSAFFLLIVPQSSLSLKVFSVIVALLIIITHRKNIQRLWKGKENRATFLFKSQNSNSD